MQLLQTVCNYITSTHVHKCTKCCVIEHYIILLQLQLTFQCNYNKKHSYCRQEPCDVLC